jgi:tRNA threonylcarbamoyladenosine biosynthesis protein TsaE
MPAISRLERTVLAATPEETTRIGRALAGVARAGDTICLWGGLGAGKTHLAKAFGSALGIETTITSPTFILMAEYAGRLPLFHVDLYRLEDATDAMEGGVIDDRRVTGVTLIEWPDRLGPALPGERLDVVIEGTGDEPRALHIRAIGQAYERYLEAIA